MAETLPKRSLRTIGLMTFVAVLVLGLTAVSMKGYLLDVFAGFVQDDTSRVNDDETGISRGNQIVGEAPAQEAVDLGGTGAAREVTAEYASPQPAQTSAPSAAQLDPTSAVIAQLDATPSQGAGGAQSPARPLLNDVDMKAILDAQRRETERRAEREFQASIAPMGGSIHSPEFLYGQPAAKAAAGRQAQATAAAQAAQAAEAARQAAEAQRTALATAPRAKTGHVLAAGSVIHAALMDDINSELPGLVRAMVTSNVWDSDTGRVIVVPQGSQLLGEYSSVSAAGQGRMAIVWKQVRLPDGGVVDLDDAFGLDAQGAVGIEGQRQGGFLTAVFQTALLNLASSIGQSNTASDAATLADAARLALGQGTASIGSQYINDKLSRGTIFEVPAGEVVNVQVARDFLFPDAVSRQGALAVPAASQSLVVPAAFAPSGPYDRNLYGDWIDADGNCKNTRHELLAALSTGPVTMTADNCAVVTGRWLDPYTDKVFTQARDMDIDHLVPLAWAHAHGADQWPPDRKAAFANDLVNLFAVDADTNRSKGAQGPLEWLPPSQTFQCQYVLRFQRVVMSYGLTLNANEGAAMPALQERLCGA